MNEHGFGRYPEGVSTKHWWGARGIFSPSDKYCKLDIPYDRQNYEGDKNNSKGFVSWINDFFLNELEAYYSELSADQNKVVKITSDDGRFFGEASCHSSGGYLYIGCWEEAEKQN